MASKADVSILVLMDHPRWHIGADIMDLAPTKFQSLFLWIIRVSTCIGLVGRRRLQVSTIVLMGTPRCRVYCEPVAV